MLQKYFTSTLVGSSSCPRFTQPLKRLVWFLDSEKENALNGLLFDLILDEPTKPFLVGILQEAALQWFKSLWQNGNVFWNSCLRDDSLRQIIHGNIAPLVFGTLEIESDKLQKGHELPIVNGSSSITLSMLQIMDSSPLYSIESKLKQLKALNGVLSTQPEKSTGYLVTDTSLLLGSIRQYLESYRHIFESSSFDQCMDLLITKEHGELCSLKPLSDLIGSTSYHVFSDVTKRALVIVLDLLPLLLSDPGSQDGNVRGTIWTNFSLTFVYSYIPDYPSHPVLIGRPRFISLLKLSMKSARHYSSIQSINF